jgi:drug/metabolite transporter (DMT)-like permease
MGSRLRGREWAAVAAVCAGLVLLATAAGAERVGAVPGAVRWSLLIGATAVAGVGMGVGRTSGRFAAPALGFVAGLGFGLVALAARTVTDLAFGSLVRNPAIYAMAVGGIISFLFYATALQRGRVTTVTASIVIGETILPAVVGVLVLGDGTRPGFVPVGVTGFVVAVCGALTLARFGEGGVDTQTHEAQARPA